MFGDDVLAEIGEIEMEDFKTGEKKRLGFFEAMVLNMDGCSAANFSFL